MHYSLLNQSRSIKYKTHKNSIIKSRRKVVQTAHIAKITTIMEIIVMVTIRKVGIMAINNTVTETKIKIMVNRNRNRKEAEIR